MTAPFVTRGAGPAGKPKKEKEDKKAKQQEDFWKGFTATLALLGSETALNTNLLSASYAGTGGAEGAGSLKGTLKPWTSGTCLNIEPVLIDAAYWVYQVHGYGAVNDITTVYEFAQEITGYVGSVSTYADLIALTLAPGQWAKAPAVGMFRLGGQPSQKVTCDVEGAKDGSTFPSTVSAIIEHLIKTANPSAPFGDLTAFETTNWCYHTKEQATLGDIARKAAYEAGGYLLPDGTGAWHLGNFFAPKTPTTLTAERTTLPLVDSYKESVAAPPIYKVRIGHSRCWSTHSDSEISPAILTISENQDALAADLAEAQDALEQAQADLIVAEQRLDDMVADGILDRAEKKYWRHALAVGTSDYNDIYADAAGYSVGTLRADFQTAYNGLTAYLDSLSPAFDSDEDITIDRAAYRTHWEAFYEAKINLLTAMTQSASTTSLWSGVSGSGKPADNATVGAPVGTYVGARPVADVLDDLEFNADSLLEQTFRVDDLDTVLDERTFVAGQPVGTVVINEITQRETDVAAINTSLDLLGAKSPDGTAWILDTSTVQTGPGQTLSATLSELSAKTDDHEAAILNLNEVLIDSDGVTARSINQINVDGHITGVVNTNDGTVGDYTIVADVFRIIDPNGGTPFSPFVYSDGVLKMTDVEVDTLKINSVATSSLQTNAVTKKLFWQDSWNGIGSGSLGVVNDDVWYDFGESGNKAHVYFTNDTDNGEVSVKLFVNLQRTGGDNDRVWFRIMRSLNGGTYTQVGDTAKAGMSNYPVIIHYEWVDTDLSAGNYDYKVQIYRDEGGGIYYSAKVIVDLGRR